MLTSVEIMMVVNVCLLSMAAVAASLTLVIVWQLQRAHSAAVFRSEALRRQNDTSSLAAFANLTSEVHRARVALDDAVKALVAAPPTAVGGGRRRHLAGADGPVIHPQLLQHGRPLSAIFNNHQHL